MQKNIIFCCFCNFKILNKNAMQNVYILNLKYFDKLFNNFSLLKLSKLSKNKNLPEILIRLNRTIWPAKTW